MLSVIVARPAHADDSHYRQFGGSLRLPLGLRALAPYNGEFCGKTDPMAGDGEASVCIGRAPIAFDLEGSYGVARKIDLLLEFRIGLEGDFGRTAADQDRAHEFHISPGGRFYFSDSGKTKLFTTAQLVFDFSGYKNAAGGGLGADFGVRNMSGLWIDVSRRYGFYGYIGGTSTFARWLRFEFEAGLGVAARYP